MFDFHVVLCFIFFFEFHWMQRKAKCVCRSVELCVYTNLYGLVCTIVTCNCLFTSNWTHAHCGYFYVAIPLKFGSVWFGFPSNFLVIIVSWDIQYFYTHIQTHRQTLRECISAFFSELAINFLRSILTHDITVNHWVLNP